MPGYPVYGPGLVGFRGPRAMGGSVSPEVSTLFPSYFQLCHLGNFALKLGDNGYHKLRELVAMVTIPTKLGTRGASISLGWMRLNVKTYGVKRVYPEETILSVRE